MSRLHFSKDELIGEEAKQSVLLLLITTIISILAFVRTPVIDTISTTSISNLLGIGISVHLIGYFLLLALTTTLASIHAYTNNGLLTSTVAIFFPLWAWQYGYLQTSIVTQYPLLESIVLPIIITLPVGATTYIVSRHFIRSDSDTSGSLKVFLGDNHLLSQQASTIVLAISIITSVIVLEAQATWIEFILPLTSLGYPVGWTALFGWFILLCWLSYKGAGLYTNWFIMTVPQFFIGTAVWLSTNSQGGLFGAIGGIIFPTVISTLLLGTTAYIIGVSLKHNPTQTTSPPTHRQ